MNTKNFTLIFFTLPLLLFLLEQPVSIDTLAEIAMSFAVEQNLLYLWLLLPLLYLFYLGQRTMHRRLRHFAQHPQPRSSLASCCLGAHSLSVAGTCLCAVSAGLSPATAWL